MRSMIGSILVVYVAWMLSPVTRAQTAPPAAGQCGEFDITFTEHSPLSARADVLKRLGEKPDAATDYDLSREAFKIYLPKNYDPSIPHGIIYYLGYKDTVATPPLWQPIMDREHMIFISTVSCAQPDWVRAGLALDAVHNLKKRYKVDDKRVWLFGFPQPPGTIPQRISFAYPDLFMGLVEINFIKNYRVVPVPGTRQAYPQSFAIPTGSPLALAKQRKYFFINDGGAPVPAGQPDSFAMFVNMYEQDGFKHVMKMTLPSREDAHYPNLTTPWLEQVLKFLNEPIAEAIAATAPAAVVAPISAPQAVPSPASRPAPTAATKPAGPSEAERALNLAKSYITARSYANARTRLQNLIAQYPDDPAVAEAKKLLAEIRDK